MSEQLLPEKGLAIPDFYMDVVENTFRSGQEGRPCFDELETVRIFVPGDRNSAAVERVNQGHKDRWPKQYEAFKNGHEAPLEGSPLSEWPPIKKSQVQEFAHFHIRTVEQLAAVDDAKLQNLGMGSRELRQQARTFMEVAINGTAPIAKMVAENMALRDQVTLLERQKAEAVARVAELEGQINARAAA